jgi:hypothetical protein
MEKIIEKAGNLLTYALHKLKETKTFNPIYGKMEKNNEIIIQELSGSISDTIQQGLYLLEKNRHNTKKSLFIFPVELDSNGKREPSIAIIIYDTQNDWDIFISQPYRFEGDKLIIGQYELIDYNNLTPQDLKLKEQDFRQSCVNNRYGKEIWLKSS